MGKEDTPMAIKTDEFFNPKSMITPGVAAAAVASIAGALFTMCGIALPPALIILSFFVGAVVFHSKEFADPKMKRWAKGFFYILNSMIIFAMATGTHSVLDKQKGSALTGTGIPFLGVVYAQEVQQSPPLLKQERPFFYDWTKGTPVPSARLESKGIVKFKAQKDFGMLKGFFVDLRLATPDYKVQVEIDKSKLPDEVKSVTWHLPAAYFAKDRVTVSEATKNFAVSIEAWRPFAIGAEIELNSGERLRVEELVSFEAKKN